jgi:hypothetical protein
MLLLQKVINTTLIMKIIIIVIFSMFISNCNGQIKSNNGIVYIYDESPTIYTKYNGEPHYYISIKSKNPLFNLDSYKFIIKSKQIGFDKYEGAESYKKEINIDTIKVNNLDSFKSIKPWQIHEFLSQNKNIKIIMKKGGSTFSLPLLYKGTEKDINLLKT